MKELQQIVVFIRPWDMPFMMQTARSLRAKGVGEKKPIVYITLWKMAESWLSQQCDHFEEVIFLGDAIERARPTMTDIDAYKELESAWCAKGGIPFKIMLSAERFKPTESNLQMDFLWRHCKVLEPILGQGTLLLSQTVDHLIYWLGCELARSRGGEFVAFSCTARPSGHTQVLADATRMRLPRSATDADRAVVQGQRAELVDGVKPDFMYAKKSKVGVLGSLKYRKKLIEEMRAGNYFVRPSDLIAVSRGPDLIHQTRWQAAQRAMRSQSLDSLTQPFVYFPLHMEPEATTLVYSPLFNDQAHAIDVIARSLPSGVSLLVKENPKMWGKRPVSFYERANRNAGLIWVDSDAPSQDILRKCVAAVTLTSTTALEAVLLDKPVACFGTAPYVSALKSLPRVSSRDELPVMLRGLISREMWPSHDVLLEEYATYVANILPTPFYGTELHEGIYVPAIPLFEGAADFIVECLTAEEGV